MTPNGTVRSRAVFFISGFDPKGAAYYHRTYRSEAPKQGVTNGWHYEVGRREKLAEHVQGWRVDATPAPGDSAQAQSVAADVEFLVWDDIVRGQWPKGWWGVLVGAVAAYWSAVSAGLALVQVWVHNRSTLLTLAYPAVFWLLVSSLAVAGSWLLGSWAGWFWGVGFALGCLALAFAIERRLHTSWLLRIYRFADRWARGRLPVLEQRLDAMAQRVADRLLHGNASGQLDDEVLVVGYSVGSMLAADVLARVSRLCAHSPNALKRLSVLTLAQCMPLLGLMPAARAYRQLLGTARDAGSAWVDVSSPSDWVSFSLIDPFAMCLGPGTQPVERRHAFVSPRFHALFSAEAYELLKKDKRRLHLQYIRSAPLPGGYDYFQITAGPRMLWDTVQQWKHQP